MENHTAKNFVLQLGSLVSLYLSLSFLLVLLFGLINIAFPDAADASWQVQSAAEGIRIGIAMTIVFFPTYIVLTRIVNNARRKDPQAKYLNLTKWLIYLSLLIGGLALLIDLVVVIMAFLNGEITQRFILKALAVLVIVGFAFYYYIQDARGVWLKNEKKSVTLGSITSVVVILSLVAGFMHIEKPTQVREQRIDQTQVYDLQNIQWRIQDHLTLTGELPNSLDELDAKIDLPEAPDGRSDYLYEVTGNGFKLCATFETASEADDYSYARPLSVDTETTGLILNPDNWEHGSGEVCFERIVN